jgi:hypothetical protein
MRSRAVALLRLSALLAAWALFPRAAHAAEESSKAEARRLFRAGAEAYDSGQFLVAATAFRESYEISGQAAVLFSMAQAYRLQYFVDGDARWLERSVGLYRRYLADTPSGGRRVDAITSLAEIEPLLARTKDAIAQPASHVEQTRTQLMVMTQVAGATAAVDGKLRGTVPLIAEVAPGEHHVTVTAKGYLPAEQRAIAVDRRLVAVEIALQPKPGRLFVEADGAANLAIDGRSVGRAPLASGLELTPGAHWIALSGSGLEPAGREISIAPDDDLRVALTLERTTQRRIAYALLGVSAAGLVTSGAFGAAAYAYDRSASTIADQRMTRAIMPSDVDQMRRDVSRRDQSLTLCAIFAAVGVGLAGAGLLTWLTDSSPPPDPPASIISSAIRSPSPD